MNGSNARIYRFAFMRENEQVEFTLIGGDGGLLERPVPVHEVFLAPSERADVLLDLRGYPVGERVMLSSLPFDAMMFDGTRESRIARGPRRAAERRAARHHADSGRRSHTLRQGGAIRVVGHS